LVVAVYSTGAHPTLMGTATVPAGGPSSHPIEVLAALELGAVPSRVGIVVVRSRPEVASVRATWQGGASAASSPLAHAQRWSVLVRPVGKGTRAPGVGSRVRVVAFSSSGRALETTVVNAVGVLYLAPVACPAS
ncbi:MAG: hypothetical protein ACRDZ5_05820, partial [Acidimicrobiales bacterium]